MFLDKNPILYAGLFQVIKRGTAKILEETEEGIYLQDTVGGAYMMASGHPDTDIRWLKKHEASDYHLFSVFHLENTILPDIRCKIRFSPPPEPPPIFSSPTLCL